MDPHITGVPFGRRSPRSGGPYSTPIHSNYRGEQLLNAEKLREALYKSELRGNPFPANNPRFAGFSYHMSLWHVPMVFGECAVSVAKMDGFGGNTALLLPSGTVAFFVRGGIPPSDPQLAAAANALRPECR